MKSALLREQELREALADPDIRRELNLALADARAAPDRLLDVLRIAVALGFRRCWEVRDVLDQDTIPPI